MSWFNVLAIALGLAMDAFAVSIATGLALERVTGRHVFRLAWHFGLFQFLMPIVGWLVGTGVEYYIAAYDHWVAFGLLVLIGGKMLREAFVRDEQRRTVDPTRGWMLVLLSVATSIDALAVGLTMALLNVAILLPSLIIGLVCGALTSFGLVFAGRLRRGWRRAAEMLGGVVLILIGVRIVLSH